MFIKSNVGKEIGDWVITAQDHECLAGVMLKGSKVKIIDIDPVRGYGIMDEDGNRVIEIGWEI